MTDKERAQKLWDKIEAGEVDELDEIQVAMLAREGFPIKVDWSTHPEMRRYAASKEREEKAKQFREAAKLLAKHVELELFAAILTEFDDEDLAELEQAVEVILNGD